LTLAGNKRSSCASDGVAEAATTDVTATIETNFLVCFTIDLPI
jgi:hypothetical protein